VFDELAAVVDQALAAKTVEQHRLAQFGVEKQRLVSRLMPNGDWADGHPLAIKGYVSERDPEAAKNLSVVLKLEEHSVHRKQQLAEAISAGENWLEAKRLYGISGAQSHPDQDVELFVVIERLKDLMTAPPPEPPLREIDGASLKQELARVAVQEREREAVKVESRAQAERGRQQLEAAVLALRNDLSQERDGNAKLRAQLAGLQQQHQQFREEHQRLREQHQRLQEEHRQSQLAAHESQQQVAALKTELAQQRETVARLTRESQTPPVTVSAAYVDQTPRPMAPYGYWASPSGYRYGGRW
jgi:DNA repair exonuclease SbcCD ATPase subunit